MFYWSLLDSLRPRRYHELGLENFLERTNKKYLEKLIYLRFICLAGFILRTLLHRDQIQTDFYLYHLFILITTYSTFILILIFLKKNKSNFFFSDAFLDIQSYIDIIFFSIFYISTLNVESDFFLLFAIPILISGLKEKYSLTQDIVKIIFITLIFIITITFVWHYSQEYATTSLTIIYLRKLLPRLVFIWGLFFLTYIVIKDRELFFELSYRNQAILNSLGEYIFAVNKKHEILWVNDNLRKYFSKSSDVSKVKKPEYCYRSFKSRDDICLHCSAQKAMETGVSIDGEEIWNLNNSKTIFSVVASPIKNRKGEIIGAVEILSDITELKRTQSLLKEQSHLTSIIESSTDAIIVTDTKGNVLLSNKGAHSLLCYSAGEFNILKSYNLYCDENGEAGKEIAKKIHNDLLKECTGKLFDYDTFFKTKNGNVIHVGLSSSLIRDENNRIIAIVGIARDKTDLDMMLEERYKIQQYMVIGNVAAYLVHKVKNDLGTLLLDIEDLYYTTRKTLTLDQKQRFFKSVSIIQSIDQKIKEIHTASGKINLRKKIIELNAIQEAIISETTSICERNKVSFIPKTVNKPLQLLIDEEHFLRVFHILRDNSLESLEGIAENERFITFRVQEQGEKVIMSWEDSGPGVNEAYRKTLFDLFFSTKEKGKGWGIGLSIAKRIIEEHGGNIFLDETKENSSKFIIMLPKSQN